MGHPRRAIEERKAACRAAQLLCNQNIERGAALPRLRLCVHDHPQFAGKRLFEDATPPVRRLADIRLAIARFEANRGFCYGEGGHRPRSDENTSELQSLMRI